MKTPQDGGPAFPLPDFEWAEHKKHNNGMTLRDYFAAAAMQGFMSSTDPKDTAKLHIPSLAFNAYAIADGMLVQRSLVLKTKEGQS